MVFEIYLDSDDRFRWHLRNQSGQIIALAAEAHVDLNEAVRSLAAVRDSSRAEIRHPQD
ncbi:uncharacterized protein YegP (UPF0339 family) [Sphingomonas kaistensis]|uniref:Uncharacterized protein YegP (UPF0339 family) n=2 Tax=Sphingomonas TaxID=13687 RepID=A0A7X5Y6S8_9SPHN|nr:DUF1508 domain-containing protein [Sphingomonas kaistensis]NJC05793.1 uncharacterized protein YegP (UPF0339 family) [Sphingomonas kaistensis]